MVGFGTGIAAWFMLGRPLDWAAFLCLAAGLGLSGFVVGQERSGRALGWFALAAAFGCALVWSRAEWVAEPRLDYVRQLLAEASGFDGDPQDLGTTDSSICSRDACTALIRKGGGAWRLLALRSATRIDWVQLTQACALADIVVSDRRLPRGCVPRWLKLDAPAFRRTGGLAIYLGENPRVDTVAERVASHSWAQGQGRLARAPDRKLAPARVDEMKAPAARK